MVLEATIKTVDGEVIDMQSRHFHPQATNEMEPKMLYGAYVKTANIRDTSIQPYRTKEEDFKFILPAGVRTVDLDILLTYEVVTPDMRYDIHKLTRRVTLER